MSALEKVGWLGLVADIFGMDNLRAASALDVFALRPPLRPPRPPRMLLLRRGVLSLLESREPGVLGIPAEFADRVGEEAATPPPTPR